jgi:hypothetical protein
VKPAYLSLILGLVLTEEISLSLANVVMYGKFDKPDFSSAHMHYSFGKNSFW